MMYSQFRVPGITLTDVKRYTGYNNVAKACKECGIELYQLTATTYNPLSVPQVKKLIQHIRFKQGERWLKCQDATDKAV